jgi:enoyl-CoA hydratase/carnithine racemase
MTKRALQRALEGDFVEATRYEVQASSLTRRASHDSEEAERAFLEKRSPTFLGR